MHSSGPPSQPPLPPGMPMAILPPLPPGPPPTGPPPPAEPPTAPSSHGNGTLKQPPPVSFVAVPASSARIQESFALEMAYPSPFDFPFIHHSPAPGTFFQFLPPMSVPPPLFTVPQPNFSVPPPTLKQPHFEAMKWKTGFPFPPPGYDVSLIKEQENMGNDSSNQRNRESSSQSRRSRSRSPKRSSSRISSRHCRSSNYTRRTRSRSPIRAKSRCFSDRGRRSRSRSHGRQSRNKISQRSRSSSRVNRRSRSRSHSKRRSRSPNRNRRRSRSNTRVKRRSRSSSHDHQQSRASFSSRKRSRSASPSYQSNRRRSKSQSRGRDLSKRSRQSPSRASKRSKQESPKKHFVSSVEPQKEVSALFGQNSIESTKSNGVTMQNSKCEDPISLENCNLSPKIIGEERKHDVVMWQEKRISSDGRKNGESVYGRERQQSRSERENLVERWRLNNCKNLEEMATKLDVLSKMEADEIIELEKQTWTRSAPADLYYKRSPKHPGLMEATPKLLELCQQFEFELIQRAGRARETFPAQQPSPRRTKFRMCRHAKENNSSSSSSCEDSSSDEEDKAMIELERKKKHPQRLHPELWHNETGEMNDGPLCRCSHRARRSGIRHNVYVGEQKLEKCNINTNNAGKLYHYRITMSPPVNFLTKTPTIIEHDSHEYIFEGFSMLSHFPLVKLPTCKVIRFNIEYTILYVDESMPENFTIKELDLFYNYLFHEVLELLDLDLRAFEDPAGCNQFHFMPRFVRDLPENGKEILSMNEVLKYLLKSNKPLVPEDRLNEIYNMSLYDWQTFADEVKCMVVTKPGMKPCSLRVDQLDRETMDEGRFPEIVHFGIRPPQLSYAGNAEYQKQWREYVKFRHLLANMAKPSAEDKRKLMGKENRLQEMRTVSKMKRDVTIALSSQGFYRTGIMCDIIQHALLLPVLVCHLRFHKSLDQLEEDMDYKFKNRYLLQLALTHPSYRENFGTNPDHARNSLTNCGIRQPEYGDRRIHYMNTRKRGINTLIQIMSRFGKKEATESNIGHNERLEFLGDAVVEFITSIHLFHLFPDLEEGGLATYRAAIVQNQHLAVMAKRLNLDAYMLYAHGSDLCHDLELRHAMANCFEALMGALFLDGGIEVADKVFGSTLWKEQINLADVWMNYALHPLQEQEPAGDRQWIEHFPVLQKLTEFESRTGIVFKHIRLLARAFTDRSVGYTHLTLGSNQRLEFLGDTVLQIIASEYLYKFFPEHHEGHLSLLRSSLVNNRTQAVVCDDLGMTEFALYANPKHDIKTKDRADLLEAYLGALYIDKGLKHCHLFCEVCFFPRLQDFIMNQDWNDPKSKLQQCCLTLRTMEGGEPDIPVYKVIQCMGPTNTRIYTVAVYFRGERLAQASGHSIQQAEMNAANEALELSTELFPQLDHQRRVIAKSMKKQKKRARREAQLKAARDFEKKAVCDERNKSRDKNYRNQDYYDRRNRHRDDDRDKDRRRERDRTKDRDRERDRDRDYDRDRERNRDRERYRDKERERDRVQDRFRDRDDNRSRDKERDREIRGSALREGGESNGRDSKDGIKDVKYTKAKDLDNIRERDRGAGDCIDPDKSENEIIASNDSDSEERHDKDTLGHSTEFYHEVRTGKERWSKLADEESSRNLLRHYSWSAKSPASSRDSSPDSSSSNSSCDSSTSNSDENLQSDEGKWCVRTRTDLSSEDEGVEEKDDNSDDRNEDGDLDEETMRKNILESIELKVPNEGEDV
ncbi:Ribonuclease 3 [Frankliniella fusca]|uniref:Ribonuclease 3 n=1 Tax=Frankliniella fusca TaxID=407009 RepID=A0AAE1HS32_9NEOP|nr:Ribonuclease 3 [Frankliniella fusca]